MLIFYSKYRFLNSRLRVSCKLDESKCHQGLNCSDCLHSFGQSPTSVYWFIVPLPIKFESSHSHPYSEMLQILTTCNCPWDWSCSPLQFDFSTAAMKWDAISSIVWFILLLKHEFKQHLHWNTYKHNKNNSCAALVTSLATIFQIRRACMSKVRYVFVFFCSEGSRKPLPRISNQRNGVCRCRCPPTPRKRLRVRAAAAVVRRRWLSPRTQTDRSKFWNLRRTL